MNKKFLLALSAILTIGVAAGIYQYAIKNSSHGKKEGKASITASPSPTTPVDLEDNSPPVNDASRPEAIEEIGYQHATKISGFVEDKECFTSNKGLLKTMKGIISRLSPNKMTEPPMPKDEKDMLYGAWTSLNIHDEKGLLYNILLTNPGGGYVVYVGGEKYSFYCDITEEDIARFQEIYRKLWKENSTQDMEKE